MVICGHVPSGNLSHSEHVKISENDHLLSFIHGSLVPMKAMVIFHFAVSGQKQGRRHLRIDLEGPHLFLGPSWMLPFWGNAAASAGYPTMRFGQLPICKCVLGCFGYINDRGERTVTFGFFASRARKTCDI